MEHLYTLSRTGSTLIENYFKLAFLKPKGDPFKASDPSPHTSDQGPLVQKRHHLHLTHKGIEHLLACRTSVYWAHGPAILMDSVE
jgi:hypothetical protein